MLEKALIAALILSIKGMMVPESVCHDPDTGYAYVSNIVGPGWENDNVGFISRLNADGSIETLKWRERTKDTPLGAPKGMCVLNGFLYCADIDQVQVFSLDDPESTATIKVPEAQRLNDLATDGKAVWASDTGRGMVVRIDPPTRHVRWMKGVPVINGITFHKSRMYAVSWDDHEVYELDPAGVKAPQPFGLAQHFTALDGIEVLDTGEIIVSDFLGNKVWLISADHLQARTLADVDSAADIGLDRANNRLFVPQFYGDQVDVFELRR